MAEPSTTATAGIISAVVLVLGPDAGDHALVMFGALIGTMHSVSKINFDGSKWRATAYMAKWIGAAVVLTAFVAFLITKSTGFPADRWPGVVAFGITFFADTWPRLVAERLPGWITAAASGIAAGVTSVFGGGKGGKP